VSEPKFLFLFKEKVAFGGGESFLVSLETGFRRRITEKVNINIRYIEIKKNLSCVMGGLKNFIVAEYGFV
jgi:hypothetical protein